MARTSRLLAGAVLTVIAASPFAATNAEAAPGFVPHAASGPYPACSSKPSAAESEKAADVYRSGKIAFDEADYQTALDRFLDAYKRDCAQHQLLIVISRAHELKGEKAAAADALKLYLDRTKAEGQATPDADTHRRREAKLRAEAAAAPAPSPTPAPTPAPAPTPVDSDPTPSPTPSPASDERGHTVVPWIVVGAGGLAFTSGVILFAIGGSNFPEQCEKGSIVLGVKGKCDDVTDTTINERAGSAQGAQTAGFWSMVGGALLVGGGLAWHFLEPTGSRGSAKSPLPPVTPVFGPGFAGASYSARF